jgi:hypothetical protein
MQDDDIVSLGMFCEGVLSSDAFTHLVQQYELQAFINWKATAPQNVKEREHAFAKLSGLQDFLLHMKSFVDQKDAIINRSEPSLEDAPIVGID